MTQNTALPVLRALPAHFAMQQHPYYAATIEALGGSADNLTCTQNNRTLGHVQIIRRKIGPLNLAWVPRGPVWAPGASPADKRDMLGRVVATLPKRAVRLITPDSQSDTDLLREMSFRKIAKGQSFARLDLTPTKPERLARQHGKWRNRLRHAQTAGLRYETRLFRPNEDMHLLRLEAAQRRARGYRGLPMSFTQTWAAANRRAARLFMAYDAGGLVAFVLILLHAPSASYHIGWINDSGRLMSAHNLLLWRASNWLAERGIEMLDLGLIDPEISPGLTRFKLGIGATPHDTGPTMLALPRLSLPVPWMRAA